jgi:hypothetical protein
MDGISQLREAEATIWLNNYILDNPVEGARFVMQKAYQMEAYLAGKKHYIQGELEAVKKSIAFLEKLRKSITDEGMRAMCDEAIRQWTADTVL